MVEVSLVTLAIVISVASFVLGILLYVLLAWSLEGRLRALIEEVLDQGTGDQPAGQEAERAEGQHLAEHEAREPGLLMPPAVQLDPQPGIPVAEVEEIEPSELKTG